MKFLRQASSIFVQVGPFVDAIDGVTPLSTVVTPARLSKNGAAFAARSSATALAHDENGFYRLELDSTDTNTAGLLRIAFTSASHHLPVWDDIMVVTPAAYDAWISGSGAGVASRVVSGSLTTSTFAAGAINDSALDITAVSEIVSGVWNAANAAFNTSGTMGHLQNMAHFISSSVMSASIAAAVWNALSTSYLAAGSMGAQQSYLSGSTSRQVWNEVLTGATFNVVNSAGRRLRVFTDARVILDGTASAATSTTITLTGGSATDDIYNQCLITITGGTGAGQSRIVIDYVGSTGVAHVNRAWTTTPDATSTFTISAFGDLGILDSGTATGASLYTLNLHTSTTTTDDAYVGATIAITTGTGIGQTRVIVDYVGSSRTAILNKAWSVVPDSTSTYVIVPAGTSIPSTSIHIGQSAGSGSLAGNNQIVLDPAASSIDGVYDPSVITILAGSGSGQSRYIIDYNGSTKTATVDRDWRVNPVSGSSLFQITPATFNPYTTEGLVSGTATSTSLPLNTNAITSNDMYNGSWAFIKSGPGQDQLRLITDYDGATRTATVTPAWITTPTSASGYAVIPSPSALFPNSITSDIIDSTALAEIVSGVWNAGDTGFNTSGTMGYLQNLNDSTGSTATVDVSAIVSGVWNAHSSSFQASSSMGRMLTFAHDFSGGRWQITGTQHVFFKPDNVTEIARYNLFNSNGDAAVTNIFERRRSGSV